MAVISELIDVGLALKEQGNHQGAIEHFRQLNQTYPNHARIMFELAGSWQAFGVPEQALPLYRQLMALPKSQGLPPKDMPRLYTQLGATLRLLGQFTESLELIEEGLSLYPEYRPLRAYRMFALHSAGYHQNAMLDAMELMLQSLAPTKWDLYEDEIFHIVQSLRERVPEPNTDDLEEWVFDEYWTEDRKDKDNEAADDDDEVSIDEVIDEATAITNGDDGVELVQVEVDDVPTADDASTTVAQGSIAVDADDVTDEDDSFEVEVKVVKKSKPSKKKPKSTKSTPKDSSQFGKKPVKINIKGEGDDEDASDKVDAASQNAPKTDDGTASSSGKINIPIDFD